MSVCTAFPGWYQKVLRYADGSDKPQNMGQHKMTNDILDTWISFLLLCLYQNSPQKPFPFPTRQCFLCFV